MLLSRFVIPFILGSTLAPIGDYFHVVTNTTGYPMDKYGLYFLGIPFWVPIQFGLAAVAIAVNSVMIDKFLKNQSRRIGSNNKAHVVIGLLAFLSIYSLSGYLPDSFGIGSDFIMASIAISCWYFLDRTFVGGVFALLVGIAGTLVEMTLVKYDVFFYQAPHDQFNGVASWLPWIYVVAAIGVANLTAFLEKNET